MNPVKSLCVLLLAFGVLQPFGSAQAQDAFVGSWVLDAASSTAPGGLVPTSGSLEISAAGDGKFKSVSEANMGGTGGRSEITPSEIAPQAYRAWCESEGIDPRTMRD